MKKTIGRNLTRKDFLNGMAWTVGATMLPGAFASGAPPTEESLLARGITPRDPRYYPPKLQGLRGSHPGSFEVAHAVRDAHGWTPTSVTDTGEHYDLVVVGGGISGLSAAHFYRKLAGSGAKVLILDNHDDFGGHAKRNEFVAGGR